MLIYKIHVYTKNTITLLFTLSMGENTAQVRDLNIVNNVNVIYKAYVEQPKRDVNLDSKAIVKTS